MKIALINGFYGDGSTGIIVKDIAEQLRWKGIEVKVYSANSREADYQIGNRFDHKLHAFMSRLTGLQGYFSSKATENLIAQLDLFNPDAVHLHNLHANYLNIGLLLKYLAKKDIPTIITLHDCFFYTGKCVYYSIVECEKWTRECGKCPQLKKGNKSWFLDRTTKMLRDKRKMFNTIPRLGVIGVSNWVTLEAKRSTVLSGHSNFTTIYNWVDLSIFSPERRGDKRKFGVDGKFMVVCVATRWTEEKGIYDILRLAEKIDGHFQIVLVGNADDINVNDKIVKLGKISDRVKLAECYATADVFFNPSRRETFGMVNAEALACGTPVIAYKTTGCGELINERCGYVEKVGDLNAVVSDLNNMIRTMPKFFCREYAEETFDKRKLINNTLHFYNKTIGSKKRRP